jgi:hypothetical protein
MTRVLLLHGPFLFSFRQSLHAPMEWAQRKDKLFITVDVEDCSEPQIELTETSLTFKYVAGIDSHF